MPKYLIEARYSPEGARGVADKGGTARRAAVEEMFRALGGSLECFYFAFGDPDVYVIGELQDNQAATALALAVNSDGRASVRTTVLLTPEEVDSAAQVSVQYRAPGS